MKKYLIEKLWTFEYDYDMAVVKELKNSDISGKYDYYEDGLFIDGKKYNKNQENEYKYNRIVKILKQNT